MLYIVLSRLTIVSREAKKKQPYVRDERVIKTHDSESRGQEEAAVRDERVSYLRISLSTEIRAPPFAANMRFMDAREVAARNMNEPSTVI